MWNYAKKALVIILLIYSKVCFPQCNLVPNPSFESYNFCPDRISNFRDVNTWNTPTEGTSDYYNTCSRYIGYQGIGYQLPKTGNGLAGIYAYNIHENTLLDYKEYIQVKLYRPLEIGKKYEVGFWCSLANASDVAVDGLGVLLKEDSTGLNIMTALSSGIVLTKQKGVIFSDTAAWQLFSISFTATEASKYLIIGNFYGEDSIAKSKAVTPTSFAYYYIDDVFLNCLNCDIQDTVVCPKSTIVLNAPTDQNNTYLWSTGSTDASIVVSEEKEYWVEITNSTENCFYRDSIKLRLFNPYQNFLPPNTTICSNNPLSVSLNFPNSSYLWLPGSSTVASIVIDSAATYSLKVTENTLGCVSSDSIVVAVLNAPEVAIIASDSLFCSGSALNLSATANTNNINFLWLPGNKTTTSITVFTQAEYVLIGTVANGCSDSSYVNTYEKDCLETIFVPNAFSPNGDGVNDFFQIQATSELSSFDLKVYNRWGNLVFFSSSLYTAWDGSYNKEIAPIGVYSFQLNYSLQENNIPTNLFGNLCLVY